MTSEPRVGCGVAILRDDCLLLVKRLRAPEAGCWSLPGGKVDLFEPSHGAAARGAAEEVGLAVGPLALLCVVDLIDGAGGTHWVSPVYLSTRSSGEARLMEPEKHDGLDWFPLDALPEPLSQAVRAAAGALAGRSRGSGDEGA